MAKIIILKGLPGAGKSTWAIDQVMQSKGQVKRVNKDDLRSMLDAGEWSTENEKFICEVRDLIIQRALFYKHDIIVDDTNFNPEHEKAFRNFASIQGAEVEVIEFDTPLEVCIQRDAARTNTVGREVIERMYNKYKKAA